MSPLRRVGELKRLAPPAWLSVAWLALAYLLVLFLYLRSGLDIEAWDDSYFFKRIGLNALEHGVFAWNVEDGPVYGNTSQGYQLVSLLALVIDPAYYISLMKLAAAAAMGALLALFGVAAQRAVAAQGASAGPERRSDRAAAWGVAFVAACIPYPLLLVHSGMETCIALAVLAGNLLAIQRGGDAPGGRAMSGRAMIVASTLLVYLVRPDAALISVIALAGEPLLRARRLPWRLLIYLGIGLVLVVGALYLYFGTPLPLSFYLKSRALTVYDSAFVAKDLTLKHKNLTALLLLSAPLLYVAVHARAPRRPWVYSLLAAAAAFTAYHFFSTVEIMSYYARFYVHALVPVALAAVAAAPDFRARSRPLISLLVAGACIAALLYLYQHRLIYDEKDQLVTRISDQVYLGYFIAATLLLLGARLLPALGVLLVAIPVIVGGVQGLPAPPLVVHDDEFLLSRYIERITTVRGIRALRACLDEPLHIYHSEIGAPGVVFQHSTVTDLAGLMDEEIALGEWDFDSRCEADQPEVLFLPHRVYGALRAEISGGTCIRNYRSIVRNSSSPLYLRRDLVPAFRACAREVDDPWVNGRR